MVLRDLKTPAVEVARKDVRKFRKGWWLVIYFRPLPPHRFVVHFFSAQDISTGAVRDRFEKHDDKREGRERFVKGMQ